MPGCWEPFCNVLRAAAPLSVSRAGSEFAGRSTRTLAAGRAVKADLPVATTTIGADRASVLVPGCEIVENVGAKTKDDSLRGRRSTAGMGWSAMPARKAGPPRGGRG